jgi:hypothetical protein
MSDLTPYAQGKWARIKREPLSACKLSGVAKAGWVKGWKVTDDTLRGAEKHGFGYKGK